MKFFSEIKRIFKCSEIYISERRNTVEASFTTIVENIPDVSNVEFICALVPPRDILTIYFISDSGDMLKVSNKQFVMSGLLSLINGMAADDNIEIKIQIDKTVSDNKFSIYDFETFSQDLLRLSLVKILKWFSTLFSNLEYLVFVVFDSNISFSTSTMAFISNEKSIFSPKIIRSQQIRICKETAFFYNMNDFEVIPEDFAIEGIEQTDNCLIPLWGKLATILSLVYTASSTSIDKGMLSIQINGQRIASYSYELNKISENPKWLRIYTWIYTDGNPADKALIAHNVISLHCKYADLLDIDDKVYDSIKSNYNLYLRNNVVHYLSLKKDISEFIRKIVAQVGEYATSILNKFKTNLIAIFGFFLTVVLTQIGTTQNFEKIFSKDIIYLIEIVVIGSFVYLFICIFEAKYKLQKIKYAYEALKENYNDILTEAEIKEAFGKDNLFKNAWKSAIKGMVIWSSIWGVLLTITILLIEFMTSNSGVFTLLLKR